MSVKILSQKYHKLVFLFLGLFVLIVGCTEQAGEAFKLAKTTTSKTAPQQISDLSVAGDLSVNNLVVKGNLYLEKDLFINDKSVFGRLSKIRKTLIDHEHTMHSSSSVNPNLQYYDCLKNPSSTNAICTSAQAVSFREDWCKRNPLESVCLECRKDYFDIRSSGSGRYVQCQSFDIFRTIVGVGKPHRATSQDLSVSGNLYVQGTLTVQGEIYLDGYRLSDLIDSVKHELPKHYDLMHYDKQNFWQEQKQGSPFVKDSLVSSFNSMAVETYIQLS